jgi:hypothetical protein
MSSPSYMKILIAQAEADKITLLKQRIESVKERIELEKNINDVANQIARNSPEGYAAIDSLRDTMEKLAITEEFQKDSIECEKVIDDKIVTFKKAHDAVLEQRALEKLRAPASRLNSTRECSRVASEHVFRILTNSPQFLYVP